MKNHKRIYGTLQAPEPTPEEVRDILARQKQKQVEERWQGVVVALGFLAFILVLGLAGGAR